MFRKLCACAVGIGLAWLLLAGGIPVAAGQPPPGDAVYAPGAVLVGLQAEQGFSAAGATAALERRGYRVARSNGPDLLLIEVPVGGELAAVADLSRLPGVAYAEPDYLARPLEAVRARRSRGGDAGRPAAAASWQLAAQGFSAGLGASSTLTPTDPDFGLQWGLTRIGAPAAWEITRGISQTIIAVLDSGIDLGHPDLAAGVWTNPDEFPGNRIDDDGNGQIDDVHGWHFGWTFANGGFVSLENGVVQDDLGHGTHVAGIVAARTDNGIGVAGVAGGATLMPVKVIESYGGAEIARYSDIVLGIHYAVANGARVINMSLGDDQYSQALCGAVGAAAAAGVVVVAAAGNDGAGSVYYPAACPGALAVGMSDAEDQRDPRSTYGQALDLLAPGVDIYSTWYYSGTQYSGYRMDSGTSMASPHVAGAAALVAALCPEAPAGRIGEMLTSTARDLETSGWDEKTGWGRVDAAGAVRLAAWRCRPDAFLPFISRSAAAAP